MSKPPRIQILRVLITCLGVGALTVGLCLPMRAQEVPLKQQLRGRHRLLRRVYVNAPDNDVKGLAASIKADEITVKHRVRAVRYLATVDSVAYPEAKEMLIDRLHNDRWEEVRFEAAKALRLMMAGNAGGHQRSPRLFRMWLRRWRRHTRRSYRTRVHGRFDFQTNPCDPATLNALVRTAYELDVDGYCFEPSMRVRTMAVMAIRASGVVCDVGPYIVGDNRLMLQSDLDVPTRPLVENKQLAPTLLSDFEPKQQRQESNDTRKSEADIWQSIENELQAALAERSSEEAFAPLRQTSGVEFERFEPDEANPEFEDSDTTDSGPFFVEEPIAVPKPIDTPAPCLSGLCVVGLHSNQQRAARPEFRAVYEDRVYHFSSANALATFKSDPERYAIAYAGFDPVAYASTQTVVDGTILRFHSGHLYSFATEENWQEFQSHSELYALEDDDRLSDDELRDRTATEFEAIEEQMQRIESDPEAFGLQKEEITFNFGSDVITPTEPSPEEISAFQPDTEPESEQPRVAIDDSPESPQSFGILEDNTAEIAEFGNFNLVAPPPAESGAIIEQLNQPPISTEPASDAAEASTAALNEAALLGDDPQEALTEIEKILGVKKQDSYRPYSQPRRPVRSYQQTNRQRSTPPVARTRNHPIQSQTTPVPRQTTVSGWSREQTRTKQAEPQSFGARIVPIGKSKATPIIPVSPERRTPNVRENTRVFGSRVNPTERSARSQTATVRPIRQSQSRSIHERLPDTTKTPVIRSSQSRTSRLLPRSSGSSTSLLLKTDPSKVTTITRPR